MIETTAADRERAQLYAAGAERHAEKLRQAARAEWVRFHQNLARLHRDLAYEHEAKAARLRARGDGR